MAKTPEQGKRITGLVLSAWRCDCGATLRSFGPPLVRCGACGRSDRWSALVQPADVPELPRLTTEDSDELA